MAPTSSWPRTSPGGSTAAYIAVSVLQKCFPQELTTNAWLSKPGEIVPSHGVCLIDDAAFARRVQAETAKVLKVENV